jgi:hypothetical protein
VTVFNFSGRLIPATVLLALLWPGPAAFASDGPLRHAIQAARCTAAQLTETARHGHVTIYEARCGGREPRMLQISCTRQACRVDDDTGTEP